MRRFLCPALLLIVLGSAFGQTDNYAMANPPKEPRSVVDAASPFYNYSSSDIRPFHLKASYQFYDLNGKPTEMGTWEYWWASPQVRRSTWIRGDAETSEWFTVEGDVYRKTTGTPLRYFERAIDKMLLSPLPERELLDSGRMKLDLKMLPPNKPELMCVFTTLQSLSEGKLQAPNSVAPSEYCFEPETMALRVTSSNQLTTQYNQVVKVQGRYLARQAQVTDGKKTLFSIALDTIEAFNPADVTLKPPPDAAVGPRVVTTTALQDSGLTESAMGSLLKKSQPVYPMASKEAGEQGVVVLGAVIGTEGKVHDLEVLATPSPMLSQAAVNAVKTWEYKPYLLNGQAAEVETIVDVIFLLGR